jgi:PAS domain S-box-containing protein
LTLLARVGPGLGGSIVRRAVEMSTKREPVVGTVAHEERELGAGLMTTASPLTQAPWYRALFEHSLDGVLLTTPDGGILAANPAMCRMLGYTEDELRTLGRSGVVDTADPRLPIALEQRRRTGGFIGGLTLIAKDGRRVPVEVSTRTFTDVDGRERTSMFVRDVTERLRAEEDLRLSEERFRLALRSAPVTVYAAGPDLRYTWFYGPHSRFRAEDVLGKRDDELAPHERVAELMALKQEVLTTGRGLRREVRFRFGEQDRFYDITAEPTRDAAGVVTGVTVAATDITDRWLREQERMQLLEMATRAREDADHERERMSILASSMDSVTEMLEYEQSLGRLARLLVPRLATFCMIDVVEDAGSVRRLETIHADQASQSLVNELRRISLAEDRPFLSRHALQTGQAELVTLVTEEHLRSVTQDEAHLSVLQQLRAKSYLCVPLVARDRTLGAITLVRDESAEAYTSADLELAKEIARRIALAIDNAHLYRQARRATELRDQILGIVSHDLRTPLTSISMAIAPFEEDPNGPLEQLPHLIEITRESIDRMERMIQDLLDVASIDAGRLSIERGPEDLAVVLGNAYAAFKRVFAAEQISFELDVPEQLPHVDVDAGRILQVVGNLLSNAVKFVPENGHVTLVARASGDEVVVSVRDDGPGIPADQVPHIFDRFWHARRTARGRGLGLGLSIAKAIIEAHGGRIWVETVEGSGSTFLFTVPVFRR